MAFVPAEPRVKRRLGSSRTSGRTFRERRAEMRRKRMRKDIKRLSRLRRIDVPVEAQIVMTREKAKVHRRVVITYAPSGMKRSYYPTVGEQTQAVSAGEVEFHASDWGEAPALLHQWDDDALTAWLDRNPKRSKVRTRRRRKGNYFDSMRP